MKKLFLILITIILGIGCSGKKHNDGDVLVRSTLIDSLDIGLERYYKNAKILRFQAFEIGYRLAYFNMLSGKFNSYADFEKQWKIDSIARIGKWN